MKNCLPFLSILILLFCFGCKSADTLYSKGRNKDVIEKVQKKASRHKAKTQDIHLAEKAFESEKEEYLASLEEEYESSQPDKWPQIYATAKSFMDFQDQLKSLEPLRSSSGYVAKFDYVDMDAVVEKAAQKAISYYDETGDDYLEKSIRYGDNLDARNAYLNYMRAEKIEHSSTRKEKIKKAQELGTIKVGVQINDGFALGPFSWTYNEKNKQYNYLLENIVYRYNSPWIEYYNLIYGLQNDIDYVLVVKMDDPIIKYSQGSTKENKYSKTLTQPKKDASGQIMRDQDGKVIMDTRVIHATVYKSSENKSVSLLFHIGLYKTGSNEIIYQDNFHKNITDRIETCDIRGDSEAVPRTLTCESTNEELDSDDDMIREGIRSVTHDLDNSLQSGFRKIIEIE